MRAWVATGTGSPADVLELREVDSPEPGPGLVRLRVDAAGLGLPDVLMCEGSYPLTPPLPFTPGQEVVGHVVAVGPDVDPSVLGSRQMGVTAFYVGTGGFAEETLVAEATMFAAPQMFTDEVAAGFHIPFQTAWIGLVDRARISPGEDLVVLGASGGSGSAAVLLGGALGARVIAVAGGEDKVAYCTDLGADVVVDHRGVDLAEAIAEATAGRGAAVVFDPVGGGPGEQASRSVANGGRFLLVGFAAGAWPRIDPAAVVSGNFSVMGVFAGAYDHDHALDVYEELLSLIEAGTLAHLPTTEIAFDALPGALEDLAARRVVGKSVLRVC